MTADAAASPASVERQHQPRQAEAVALDDAREHGAQLLARRVVGVVAELLDAVGECGVREHQADALQRPVDAALRRGRPQRVGGGLTAGEPLERLSVIVAERGDGGIELLVRRRPQRPVEQSEGLQAGLHLVHGPSSYRGDALGGGQ